VRQLKELPLNYAMLAELGTQPRTTYLAKCATPIPLMPGTGMRPRGNHGRYDETLPSWNQDIPMPP
jgi:hypothetical protein